MSSHVDVRSQEVKPAVCNLQMWLVHAAIVALWLQKHLKFFISKSNCNINSKKGK